MRKPKHFYVYIMTNRQRSHVLYTGAAGHLVRRVFLHKNKLVPGFTSRYNLTRLAHYEPFVYPDPAIAREKEIKGWRRSKKIRLIESSIRFGVTCLRAGGANTCQQKKPFNDSRNTNPLSQSPIRSPTRPILASGAEAHIGLIRSGHFP